MGSFMLMPCVTSSVSVRTSAEAALTADDRAAAAAAGADGVRSGAAARRVALRAVGSAKCALCSFASAAAVAASR